MHMHVIHTKREGGGPNGQRKILCLNISYLAIRYEFYFITSQMSSHKLRGKQIMVYPYNGMLLSDVKEWSIDVHNNKNKLQHNYAKWKKPGEKSTYWIIHKYKTLENAN